MGSTCIARRAWAGCLYLLATSLLLATPLVAQEVVRISPQAISSPAEVDRVLRDGLQLEQQRRWSEALTHYEDALREHPGDAELEQRVTLARLHYDVARRYADPTYLQMLERSDEHTALEAYSEVLLKIHTHYVQAPNWRHLIARGLLGLEVALAEPGFVQHNLPQATAEQMDHLLQQLRSQLGSRPVRTRHEARELVARAARLGQQQLGLPGARTVFEFTCAATGSLDEYSSYLTAGQLDDVFSQIEGNFVGLGIELRGEDGALVVVSVISGSPADEGALRAGDRIVQVDGKVTEQITTDAAADMLKGPEGSSVEVVVVGQQGERRTVRLVRQRVEVPSVESVQLLEPELGVGYVKLTSFQKTTSRDVDAALWQLHREGMKTLILDLRGNPGGLLTAAVDVADKFISQGAIVSTRGRSPREDYDYKAHAVGTWRVPLIVLIDGDSASASEIFAGAIRDHRRGTVVGQRSYGKGSVQGIFPLNSSHSGLRLTTAKFYSPNGHPISHRGVHPDVVVNRVAKPTEEGWIAADDQDAVLKAALQVARQQLTQR